MILSLEKNYFLFSRVLGSGVDYVTGNPQGMSWSSDPIKRHWDITSKLSGMIEFLLLVVGWRAWEGGGCGIVLLALPVFLPSIISSFLPKVRVAWAPPLDPPPQIHEL